MHVYLLVDPFAEVSLISLMVYTYKVRIATPTDKFIRERQRVDADAMSELSTDSCALLEL